MKHIPHMLLLALNSLLVCCQQTPREQAKEKAKEISETIKKTSPGFIATSANGYYMKATIAGKPWIASAMLPSDRSESRRIQAEGSDETIGFYIWIPHLKAGDKIRLKDGHAADLFTSGDPGIWGGQKGEIEITKMDGQIVEGIFHFTGTSFQTDKTIEVTDGYFRLPLSAPNR